MVGIYRVHGVYRKRSTGTAAAVAFAAQFLDKRRCN